MNDFTIYLSGGMQDLSLEASLEWRNRFEDAIERVEKAKTQKALNGTSQILIGDINKSLKGLSPVEQNKVMTSKEVTTIERVYNKKLTEKRKSLR